ncbi:ribonuclease Z [Nocardia sp. NPDC019395]|uniref:ribonuclease Z n=1 Tax=Nocardia sp. NPDC019395 TaxID=3154686 RepID=UPI0033C272AC
MSQRELVVLGTASQVPTAHRNHNGYVLRWGGEAILFDPGEGTQRQMIHAGISATDLSRIAVTHFHGDHSLGLAGVVQRINLDRVPHPIDAYYPSSGQRYFDNLCDATAYHRTVELRTHPISEPGPLQAPGAPFRLATARLDHPVEAFGYRLTEPDYRAILPDRLTELGLSGPLVGRLQREGEITWRGRTVRLEEVSTVRRGQSFAFVMDTRVCAGAHELAAGVDMLVIEATFTDADAALAEEHGHLTAGQAARIAAEAGARTLVLTHFSQRYRVLDTHLAEAHREFDGEVVIASDLARIPLPPRR